MNWSPLRRTRPSRVRGTRLLPLCLVFFGTVSSAPLSAGQDPQAEEKVDPFAKWLNQDVVYIISPEEKAVFSKLAGTDEKESFIEQFWRRRDPDPSSSFNEFKTEHYRRIAYSNERFHSGGIPGWKSDRGRIYIALGPPTSVDRYGAGQTYYRDLEEGGGTTAVYPMEKWYYGHVEHIGSGIEIEFVDKTMTGEYRMALRPEEKDALLYMDGAGLTLFERMGLDTRAGRIRAMDPMRSVGGEFDAVHKQGENPFLRLDRFFRLQQAPRIQFKDLKAAVTTNISYDELPIFAVNSYTRLTGNSFLVPITVFLPLNELAYEPPSAGAAPRATVHLYGSVKSMGGRIVSEFEETIYDDRRGAVSEEKGGKSFQKVLPLPPGIYKLDLIAKDLVSQKIGHLQQRLMLPVSVPKGLSLSSLVLSDMIVPAQEETLPSPFVTALGWKVYPAQGRRFSPGEKLGLYFEVYSFDVDQSRDLADLDITAAIMNSRGERLIDGPATHLFSRFSDRVAAALVFPLDEMETGDYTLLLRVEDKIQQRDVRDRINFKIVPTDS